jgi:hypothetical protein
MATQLRGSILNENLYNKLRHAGLKRPELPAQEVNLVSAFRNRSKRVKKQPLLEADIGSTRLEEVMLLSTQVLTEAILGLDFLIIYKAEISFPERRITLTVSISLCYEHDIHTHYTIFSLTQLSLFITAIY